MGAIAITTFNITSRRV